jgi:hypothetical protein
VFPRSSGHGTSAALASKIPYPTGQPLTASVRCNEGEDAGKRISVVAKQLLEQRGDGI